MKSAQVPVRGIEHALAWTKKKSLLIVQVNVNFGNSNISRMVPVVTLCLRLH